MHLRAASLALELLSPTPLLLLLLLQGDEQQLNGSAAAVLVLNFPPRNKGDYGTKNAVAAVAARRKRRLPLPPSLRGGNRGRERLQRTSARVQLHAAEIAIANVDDLAFALPVAMFGPPVGVMSEANNNGGSPAAKKAKVAAEPTAAIAAEALATLPAANPYLATLRVKCKDKIGVVAAVAQLLFGYGINILQSDQVDFDVQ
ncbi:hypothetical protein JKP88DRAFT_318353 [Tribonema minus]|uniref:ACT domain-containing protein n=1 Tax=Tribonema minus TaxID=303371 RepID=A0A836CET0_9STRA|nr:hypothetical protein JKP88DRAFT_318353 [Tribonema minus]